MLEHLLTRLKERDRKRKSREKQRWREGVVADSSPDSAEEYAEEKELVRKKVSLRRR